LTIRRVAGASLLAPAARRRNKQTPRLDPLRLTASIILGDRLADIDPGRRAPRAVHERYGAALAALRGAGRLADPTASRVQEALAALRGAGRSLQTLNHHRAAVRSFLLWARKDGRLRDDPLFAVAGVIANEDRGHRRRTLSVDVRERLAHHLPAGGTVRGVGCRMLAGTKKQPPKPGVAVTLKI
jgi:hypothetical protein